MQSLLKLCKKLADLQTKIADELKDHSVEVKNKIKDLSFKEQVDLLDTVNQTEKSKILFRK